MTPSWLAVGEAAVLLQFGTEVSDELSAKVQAFVRALTAVPVPGLVELVPAYGSVLITFDPTVLPHADLRESVSRALRVSDRPDARDPSVLWEIPVVYGGESGPDLDTAARALSLTNAELIRVHSSEVYRVHALGYAPGFPYLGVLPEAIRLPRHADPRDAVPAGSVGMADLQTAVFPVSRPSGWHLLGWTPVRLFRPDAAVPFVLAPGDRVKFRAVAFAAEAKDLTDAQVAKKRGRTVRALGISARYLDPPGPALVRVKEAGHHTLVQDLGRTGYARYGIPAGGAMDPEALGTANLLAGNDRNAAALESVWEGPTLEALEDCWAGISGAATLPRRNGELVPNPGRIRLRKGDVLRVGRVVHGLHVYVALSGGIAAERFLGSAATYVPAALGGIGGAVVRKGTTLFRGTSPFSEPWGEGTLPSALRDPVTDEPVLRALPGPHLKLFQPKGLRKLFSSPLSFTPRSDRTGLRIDGAKLSLQSRVSLTSFGLVRGALQVPGTGEPILLAADAHAVGGYPVAAVVIQADLPRIAQIQPGDHFRLHLVDPAEAIEALRERRESLDAISRFCRGEGLFGAWRDIEALAALPQTAQAGYSRGDVRVRISRRAFV